MAPTALWSSDLARARETADQVATATGLADRYDARLREFDVGERAGLTVPEFAERHPEAYAAWKAGHITGDVPGAETLSRSSTGWCPRSREIWARRRPGETTVVISHGACLKVSLLAFLGWPRRRLAASLRGWTTAAGWSSEHRTPAAGGVRLAAYNRVASYPAVDGPDFRIRGRGLANILRVARRIAPKAMGLWRSW